MGCREIWGKCQRVDEGFSPKSPSSEYTEVVVEKEEAD